MSQDQGSAGPPATAATRERAARLGVKQFDGTTVTAGSIIVRQRGTKIYPGANVKIGGDDTLFATADGVREVRSERRGRKHVSIIAG